MFRGKKISSDMLLLALLVVHLRLGPEINRDNRWNSGPETRDVYLGSSSAYIQTNFHNPYMSYRHTPSKVLDYDDFDDRFILYNRLNYFRSFRENRDTWIAYFASRPQTVRPSESEDSNSNPSDGSQIDQPQHLAEASSEPESCSLLQCQELSPEDMNLIEILWKQDIDLGVSRDAYDPFQTSETEKLKEVEHPKETTFQEFFEYADLKGLEDEIILKDPWAGVNYTIDSETGEHVVPSELPFRNESDVQLLENGLLGELSPNFSISFDENAQFPNFNESFPSEDFSQLLPDVINSDSEFLAAQIEDLEKELSRCAQLGEAFESEEAQNELFPTMEDCWQDLTTMLPLSVLGFTHQGSYTTMLPRPVNTYHNLGSSNFTHLNHTPPLNPNESLSSMLLQNTTLPIPNTDENNTFHCLPSGPSSIGCAVAESIATLTNDTEPTPSGSVLHSLYNSDLPELLYPNQTAVPHHGEFFLSDLLLDEDFQLMDMSAPSDVNHTTIPKTEEHMDTSSDSLSLTSGRVPSLSDCQDWVDTCSESSSHQDDEDDLRRNRNPSFALNSEFIGNLNHRQTSMHANSDMVQPTFPKKPKFFSDKNKESGNRNLRDASFEGNKGKNSHYCVSKSSFNHSFENSACAMSDRAITSDDKYGMNIAKVSNGNCNDFFHHNHSYHLPFTNGDSLNKPIARDKSRSAEEEDAINKDEKKAKELKLPISIDDIINLAIDEFNERLSKYELTEPQLTLIRDIRRRGKNKVAAQNCRKRKMDQISTLQQDLDLLQSERLQLQSEQNQLLRQRHYVQDKYAKLYHFVLQSTNSKPPDPPACLPVLSSTTLPFPSSSETVTSDDDCDLGRGARTKRKTKK